MATFLQPLLRQPDRQFALVIAESGALLVSRVIAAVDSETRRRGLLGRSGLDDEALAIAPCNAVHTFFMKFAIDVVFVDRQGRVTRVAHAVRPWRIAGAWRGFAVIELAAGTAARAGLAAGQRVELRAS